VPAARKAVDVAPRAQRDIDDAAAQVQDEAGVDVALRFLGAVESAFDLLARNPGVGSPRQATLLRLPGVRCWPLRPWPQLIFYVERDRALNVIRVLHGARDIPAALAEPDAPGQP
jgi:toxin ParE1/3/4